MERDNSDIFLTAAELKEFVGGLEENGIKSVREIKIRISVDGYYVGIECPSDIGYPKGVNLGTHISFNRTTSKEDRLKQIRDQAAFLAAGVYLMANKP